MAEFFQIALVGMEMHLAVRQRAQQFAVFPNVRHQHREFGMLDDRLFVARFGRPRALLQDTEVLSKADLVVLGQLLVAEQQNEMLMPGVDDLGERLLGYFSRRSTPTISAPNAGDNGFTTSGMARPWDDLGRVYGWSTIALRLPRQQCDAGTLRTHKFPC